MEGATTERSEGKARARDGERPGRRSRRGDLYGRPMEPCFRKDSIMFWGPPEREGKCNPR